MYVYKYKYKRVEFIFDEGDVHMVFYSRDTIKWEEKLTKKSFQRIVDSIVNEKPAKIKSLQFDYVDNFVNIRAKKKGKFMSMMFPILSFRKSILFVRGVVYGN